LSSAGSIAFDRMRAWWPAVVWAAIMFVASTDAFSAQNTGRILAPILRWFYAGITQEQLDLANYIVRKGSHLAEYFVLYVLVYRGLSNRRARWRLSWALGAWLTAAVYAALDEFHQSFVASRTSSPWDSLLDSSGALIALCVVFVVLRVANRRPAN
jgi:VanZ family protein